MRIPLLRSVDGVEAPSAPILHVGHALAQGVRGVWVFSNVAPPLATGANQPVTGHPNPSVHDLLTNRASDFYDFNVAYARRPYPLGGYGLALIGPYVTPSPAFTGVWNYAGLPETAPWIRDCTTRGTMLVVRRHLNPRLWLGQTPTTFIGCRQANTSFGLKCGTSPPEFWFGNTILSFTRPASFGTIGTSSTPGVDGTVSAIAAVAGTRGMAVYIDGLLVASSGTPVTRTEGTAQSQARFSADLFQELFFVAHLDAEWSASQVIEWTRDPFVFVRPPRVIGGGSLLALEPEPEEPPAGTGTIIVRKVTNPGDAADLFTFRASPDLGSFALADGESYALEGLAPGTYSITEDPLSGWESEGDPIVSSGDPVDALVLDDSETIEVEFHNLFIGDDPDPDPDPDTEPPDVDDDLEITDCPAATVLLTNLALSRIGVSRKIVDLTEDSQEAEQIRLVYELSLQATLRDRAWPFATRYAALTRVSGSIPSPVNADYTFTYRLPGDCVFARRLVVARGTGVNPTPPPMRIGNDILFTNEVNPTLEYTARVSCPAAQGDATFRSAWAWRMAHEMAPALSRMDNRETHCWTQYQAALAVADTFLRLGSPGVRANDDSDPDVLCLAVKTQVINMGLVRIGAQTVANLATEQSREALTALLVYEDELRATLRDYAWPFATAYADGLTVIAGSTTTHATPDYRYAYRLPSDWVYVRRIVKPKQTVGVGRVFDPAPDPFLTGSDGSGGLLYTDVVDVAIEYTARTPCALARGDVLFREAVSWRLGAALAPSLAVPNPEAEEQTGRTPTPREPRSSEGGLVRLEQLRYQRAQFCLAMYQRALGMARAAAGNEQQREPDGPASWIRARG